MSANPHEHPAAGDPLAWLIPLALFLGAFALYTYGLAGDSVDASDEALYQETAREMLESGDWFSPQFDYEPRYQKPPMQYWLIALSFRAFGVTAFAGRLPAALASALTVLIAYQLGLRVFGRPAGVWGACLLAVVAGHQYQAQDSKPDAALVACVWLAILAVVEIAHRQDAPPAGDGTPPQRRGERLWQVVLWVALGLGTLLKGPIALVEPFLVCGTFVVLTGRWRLLGRLGWAWGVPLLLLIAVPWYAGMWALHGHRFIEVTFLRENVHRFLAARSRWTWSYYLQIYPVVGLPVGLLLIPAAWESIALLWRRDARHRDGLALCWGAVVVVLTFFSIAKGKLALYIMPTYLPASLLAGLIVYRCHSGQAASRGACYVGIVLAVLMLGMLSIGLRYLVSLGASPLVPTAALATAFALLGAVAAPVIAPGVPADAAPSCGKVTRTAMLVAMGALIGATAGLYVLLNTFVWPFQESRNPLQPVVRAVAPLVTRETPVIVCGYERGWKQMAFYLRRKIIRARDAEELLQALPAERAVCVLPVEEMRDLPPDVQGRVHIVARFPFPSKARLMRQVENLRPLVDPRYQTTLLVARWEPGPGGRPASPSRGP